MRRSSFRFLALIGFIALAIPAAASTTAQDPPADGEVGVIGVAYACPSADVEPSFELCDTLGGVTVQVFADGAEVAGSPFTTDLNSIGSNSIEFNAPENATLTITQVSGIPEGYVPASGSDPLVAIVADLPIGGTGGESTSPYAFLVNVPAEQEASGSSLTVSAVNCPLTGPDSDIDYAACTEPAAGIEFAVGTPNSGNVAFAVTDADGVFSTSLDPYDLSAELDSVLVGEVLASSPYGEITGYDATCTNDLTGEEVPLSYDVGEVGPGGTTYEIAFDFAAGDQISCTWFNVYQLGTPEQSQTAVTEPVDPQPIEPEPTAPDPDALRVSIRGGSCDETGDIVADLASAQLPEGDAIGQETAVPVQTSVSSAAVSLEDMLAGDHVIDVRAPDDDTAVLACGEIGGVLDGNGDLTIGLPEVDESGFSGVAYLAPNDTDPSQTGISVFIAEGLSPDTGEDSD